MRLRNEFDWESLLERRPIATDREQAREALTEKSILVTGAGGSIGSALTQAIAEYAPRQLLLLEAAEQSLYNIDRALKVPHVSILASVCDSMAVRDLFERYRPEIIFHAAAFKHVPLIERNPFAAIQNNVIGTFTLTELAAEHGAEQLVMLSTDKAVEPLSMMGASKRCAELVLLAMQTQMTRMIAVRLGNVLGSQGSVLPLFLEQIARGGPVTVAHPEASRYFMTLEEAVGLLLLASSRHDRGILAPDLGQPIRVEEMARKLMAIRKKGSMDETPMVITGLRPGDKLSEKLLSSREAFWEDATGPLRPIRSIDPNMTPQQVKAAIHELQQALNTCNFSKLLDVVLSLVPEYRPSVLLSRSATEFSPGVKA